MTQNRSRYERPQSSNTSFLLVLTLAAGSLCGEAAAQGYPSRPVTLVVPYQTGGSADIVGRVIGQSLGRSLREQVVVDNRPGAGGNIGAALAARAPADGHTIMIGTNTHAVNMTLYRNPGYDIVKDFASIGMVSSVAYVLVVHPSLPVMSVKDLVALARKLPNELMYASSGNGSTPHLAAEVFKMATGIRITHVPYKGAGDAMTDNLAGRVPVAFASISTVMDFVKANRLRALAVTSAKRQAVAPNVPTLIEAGYENVEVTTWNGLFVPRKTASAVIARLSSETVKAVNDPEVRERFAALGLEPISSTPQELESYLNTEVTRWGKVVRASGITID
jgi:tripartite-type tricarboxylate transporter receptor subunit TctC